MASWRCEASVLIAALVAATCGAGCRRGADAGGETPRTRAAFVRPAGQARAASGATAEAAGTLVEVPPPPFSEGVFPCSDCHAQPDLPPNRTRRALVDAHDEIVLKHDAEHRWCLDCHDANDRDSLHLASGDLVPFAQSYTLCGQCHGEKARDWRAGVHGRRTGFWNGRKEYLLCVHCHDPHAPRFKAIAPMPAPLRPEQVARNESDRQVTSRK
jgi:hypothetical protein